MSNPENGHRNGIIAGGGRVPVTRLAKPMTRRLARLAALSLFLSVLASSVAALQWTGVHRPYAFWVFGVSIVLFIVAVVLGGLALLRSHREVPVSETFTVSGEEHDPHNLY